MKNIVGQLRIFTILLILGAFAVVNFYRTEARIPTREGASGMGSLSVQTPDGRDSKRQFSFSAHRNSDGTVSGNAVLHNPAFTGANDQRYQLQIDISCMKVYGNIAFFGGLTQRTNDPNLVDAVYFSVQDNGEPGKDNDMISSAFFFDDDPNTTGDPQICQNHVVGDFPMYPIESGNIQLRVGTTAP
jgi:hypothetical protein